MTQNHVLRPHTFQGLQPKRRDAACCLPNVTMLMLASPVALVLYQVVQLNMGCVSVSCNTPKWVYYVLVHHTQCAEMEPCMQSNHNQGRNPSGRFPCSPR